LFCVVAALLVAQPDLGQTILTAITWGAMFFMAGVPWLWIIGLGILAVGGFFGAYTVFPHVAGRIDRFLTGEGDTFQVDTGREAIIRGGWFGQGPGEGTIKRIIPDSHTDFIFSVTAEEYGIALCLLIVVIFAFIVIRGLSIALKERDDFTRLSVSGLVILFGFQSIINTSLIAVAISTGLLLALTRRRPEARRSATLVDAKMRTFAGSI
jgi:cell division protein FtsW